MLRKYVLAAIASLFASAGAYLFLSWLFIYPLGPEHPEILPQRLMNEAFAAVTWITILSASIEMISLGCAFQLVAKARTGLVLFVAAAAPAFVLGFSQFFPESLSIWSFLESAAFFLSFIVITFIFLWVGVRLRGR